MTRIMYDAFTPGNLPATVPPNLYAAYIDGILTSENYVAVEARFPGAQILSVTTDGSGRAADICDCETGDYDPLAAVAWAKSMLAQGRAPTIYASRSTWATIGPLAPAGVTWWAATLDGTTTVPGAVAVQYMTVSSGYDVSLVTDDTWHALPAPAPPAPVPGPPKPDPPEEEPMDYLVSCPWPDPTSTTSTTFVISGGTKLWVIDPTAVAPLEAKLGAPIALPTGMVTQWPYASGSVEPQS